MNEFRSRKNMARVKSTSYCSRRRSTELLLQDQWNVGMGLMYRRKRQHFACGERNGSHEFDTGISTCWKPVKTQSCGWQQSRDCTTSLSSSGFSLAGLSARKLPNSLRFVSPQSRRGTGCLFAANTRLLAPL